MKGRRHSSINRYGTKYLSHQLDSEKGFSYCIYILLKNPSKFMRKISSRHRHLKRGEKRDKGEKRENRHLFKEIKNLPSRNARPSLRCCSIRVTLPGSTKSALSLLSRSCILKSRGLLKMEHGIVEIRTAPVPSTENYVGKRALSLFPCYPFT